MNQLISTTAFLTSLSLLSACGSGSSSSGAPAMSKDQAISECQLEIIRSNSPSSLPDNMAAIEAKAERDMRLCLANKMWPPTR